MDEMNVNIKIGLELPGTDARRKRTVRARIRRAVQLGVAMAMDDLGMPAEHFTFSGLALLVDERQSKPKPKPKKKAQPLHEKSQPEDVPLKGGVD